MALPCLIKFNYIQGFKLSGTFCMLWSWSGTQLVLCWVHFWLAHDDIVHKLQKKIKSTLSNSITFPFTRQLYNFKKFEKCQKYFYQLGSLFLQEPFHIQDSTHNWLLWNKRWIQQINWWRLTAFPLLAIDLCPSIFGDVSKQILH